MLKKYTKKTVYGLSCKNQPPSPPVILPLLSSPSAKRRGRIKERVSFLEEEDYRKGRRKLKRKVKRKQLV